MLKNKLIKAVATAALMFTMVSSVFATVKAGQSKDFYFVFDGVGSIDYTTTVNKTNTSYVSMKCTNAEIDGSSYTAYVVNRNTGVKSSADYTFYDGTYHLMANSIIEDARSRGDYSAQPTRINASCKDDVYGEGAIFEGYWYADSDIY